MNFPNRFLNEGYLRSTAIERYLPVPVRLTMCGLPAALSVIVTAPVRIPVALGVNLTLILQLDPAATDEPHVLV